MRVLNGMPKAGDILQCPECHTDCYVFTRDYDERIEPGLLRPLGRSPLIESHGSIICEHCGVDLEIRGRVVPIGRHL